MASYRCSIKPNLKRSAGQSLVNSAAYIAREKLGDERTGRTFNYTRHPDKALWTGVYAPANAPEWARDVESLCNQMEQAERYKNAQLARPMELNLPHELTLEENRRLLQDYIRENFTRKGYAVMAAIHAPGQDGDERNIHAHLLISLRTLDEEGFAKTKREQQQQDFLHRSEYTNTLKASWAKLGARHLERASQPLEAARWSHGHQTLAEQQAAAIERGDMAWAGQCDREATKHLGPHAAAMEEKGVQTERGNLNRDIEQRNRERAALRVALQEVQRELAQETVRDGKREGSRQPGQAARQEAALDGRPAPQTDTRGRHAENAGNAPPSIERHCAWSAQFSITPYNRGDRVSQQEDTLRHHAEQSRKEPERPQEREVLLAAEREAARLAQEQRERQQQIKATQEQERAKAAREKAQARDDEKRRQPAPTERPYQARPRAGIATQVRDPNAARTPQRAASGGLRVAGTVAGKAADRLVDMVDGLLDFFVGPTPRQNSVAEFLNNREARRAQYQQISAERQREEAIDHMAEDIRSGRLLSPADVRNLNQHDLISIKQFGDDYMRQLIEERERERERKRDWGGRERER